MANYRPLHEVIVAQLAHLCETYAVEAGIVGKGGMTDKLVWLGAEISALCAVLDNGVVPVEHLAGVTERLRAVAAERLSGEAVCGRHAARRFETLVEHFGQRGESVDGLRSLHEVLLRWTAHQVELFAAAVLAHNEDRVFCVGAEIQACANALMGGVVPASEIRGAVEWLGEFIIRLPRGAEGPTISAVAGALRTMHADLESRELPSPPLGKPVPVVRGPDGEDGALDRARIEPDPAAGD